MAAVSPSEYPPPVEPGEEFIGPPTDPEDERIEVGVAIVGGGQAGLACAIRLLQLLEDDPELTESLGEVPVAVLEKGKVAGAHQLSGAVMNPSSIRELFPDDDSWPHYGEVQGEAVYFMLNRKRAARLRPVPPPFRNHGNYVVAVAELNRWLAERAEEAGAYILSETAGQKLLVEDGMVRGVRTGDKGRDKDGGEKANFEPGSDVVARATVLAEGCWGHLTGAALRGLELAPKDPQVWALGVKEVWEIEQPLDKIIHTLGWPLRPQAKYKEFGGSWIYGMNREGEAPKASVGFVVGLDWADARLSPHDLLQEFKLHPLARKILEGGKRVGWGAKAIPEGGYWAMPRLHAPGMVICGDSGGMVNVPRLKGVHYAIKSGMLAAETIYQQLKAGSTDLSGYEGAVFDSVIGKDLWQTRNMKQPFGRGLVVGGAITNAMVMTKGRFPGGHWPTHRDAEQPVTLTDRQKDYPKPDGKYTFDKLSGVFLTGNATRDDAPSHIRVQKRVPREVAEAWQWMCPAAVYEIPEDAPEEGFVDLIVNPSNCVQCGAITAKGGRLTPPEGGDGPRDMHTEGPLVPRAGGRALPPARGIVRHVSGSAGRRMAPSGPAGGERARPSETPPSHAGSQDVQRRMTILAATVTLAAAAGAPLPAAGAPPLASSPTVALLACSTGLTPGERTAVFEGRMSRVPGTRRMQMRFTLQSHRGAGERWTAVAGPGLGAWVSSDPGVTRYTFTKRIENLSVPAAYRMAVRFRWLDAGGRSIRTGRAISKLCHEPDLRPQLVPGRINVAGIGDPARRRYVVTVRNRGRTAAGPFDVALDAPAPLPAGHVVDLGPGATTLVAFEGPRCQPGATLTATVDPTGFVDEADENDNTLAVPCPPAAR